MKKRADGRYQMNLTITGADGKPKRKTFYGASPPEVRRKVLEFTGEQAKGKTLREVCEGWQAEAEQEIRYNTRSCYKKPTEDVLAEFGDVRIRELSDEALRLTVRQGAEAGNIEVDIPEAFTFPVYKHAFRLFFNYIYLFAAGPRRFAVSVSESEGMMTVSFRSSRTLLKSLQEHLSEDPAPSPEAGESEDSLPVFLHRLVRVMMVQLNPVVAYSDIDSVLSLSFLPAKAGPEKPVIDRKIVLLLEDHDEMYWLLDDILSDE